MKKIVLGLSGGVDSAVVANILKRDGFEVFALYLDMGIGGEEAARQVADSIGVSFASKDIREELREKVCDKFVDEYLNGRTPNPCIMCNPTVKFPSLIEYADKIGADYIATGHYAVAENGCLYKGRPSNDQSYMMSRLPTKYLKRCIFPLGKYEKTEVRALAKEMGLAVADKPDSMEICFIPDGDYANYIEEKGKTPSVGNFVDESGNILGTHKGIHHYTLGQGRRLGIALGKKVFVSKINPNENTITLSDGDGLFVKTVRANDINILSEFPAEGVKCDARIRHSKTVCPAFVVCENDEFVITFDDAVRAPTAGQSAVCYIGEKVICSGYIMN